jgi:hypothetical protein
MNKSGIGIGLFRLKTTCLALTLILGMSLFVAGAFAELGCGENCCCHRSTMNMHHSKEMRVNLSTGFCNRNPVIPCDIETGPSTQLPNFILFCPDANQPNTLVLIGANTDFLIDRHSSRAGYYYQSACMNCPSAPIYLQNSSFII